MKVVIFVDTYPPEINGVATSVYNLHETLVNHGEECLVVTTNPYTNKLLREGDIIRVPGIELKKLYGYRLAGFYNAEAARMVKEFRPDVFHINHDGPVGQFGNILSLMLGVPQVYTYHTMYEDYSYYFTKGLFDRAARKIVQFYTRFKSNSTGEFISPSQKTKNYLRAIGVDSYINIIPTGIDFSMFDRKKEDIEASRNLKKQLGIREGEFVILYLGRVAKEKSLDVLLDGYAAFLKVHKGIKTRFLIVGSGPDIDIYKKQAHDLGLDEACIFAGAVKPEETYKYYWISDCFVSASLSETQGLTFMEAMASSVPVLARYDDNLAGTISDGTTGFFFRSLQDFPKNLEKVITLSPKEKREIKENALKKIDQFSMENFYLNVMEAYRRAIVKHF